MAKRKHLEEAPESRPSIKARCAPTAGDAYAKLGLLEAAIERLQQGFCVYDRELRLVQCNRRYAEMHGLPPELTQLTITPQRYAVFTHDGHISEISRTWMDIFGVWLPQSGREVAPAPSFECYGEAFDPKVAIGNVEIWIAIKA